MPNWIFKQWVCVRR